MKKRAGGKGRSGGRAVRRSGANSAPRSALPTTLWVSGNALDRQMLDWTCHRGLATHVLLTKSDKLSRGAAASTLAQVRRELAAQYPNAGAQLFSSLDRSGLDAAHARLDAWFGFGDPAGS